MSQNSKGKDPIDPNRVEDTGVAPRTIHRLVQKSEKSQNCFKIVLERDSEGVGEDEEGGPDDLSLASKLLKKIIFTYFQNKLKEKVWRELTRPRKGDWRSYGCDHRSVLSIVLYEIEQKT